MSRRPPKHESWHSDIPAECTCDAAYSDRKLVDPHCWFHDLVDAVIELRSAGWTVEREMDAAYLKSLLEAASL